MATSQHSVLQHRPGSQDPEQRPGQEGGGGWGSFKGSGVEGEWVAAKHSYLGHKALSPGIETLISKPGSGIEGERRLPSWSSPANTETFLSGQSPQEKGQALLPPREGL